MTYIIGNIMTYGYWELCIILYLFILYILYYVYTLIRMMTPTYLYVCILVIMTIDWKLRRMSYQYA